eukprot:GEMP01039346.1.p1 GENE.GEMP01039346.1~~GEMP01039346.1.p1  ORF type:complete len:301 (-),score=62.19 GEMP01039346.1:1022-1924(-)
MVVHKQRIKRLSVTKLHETQKEPKEASRAVVYKPILPPTDVPEPFHRLRGPLGVPVEAPRSRRRSSIGLPSSTSTCATDDLTGRNFSVSSSPSKDRVETLPDSAENVAASSNKRPRNSFGLESITPRPRLSLGGQRPKQLTVEELLQDRANYPPDAPPVRFQRSIPAALKPEDRRYFSITMKDLKPICEKFNIDTKGLKKYDAAFKLYVTQLNMLMHEPLTLQTLPFEHLLLSKEELRRACTLKGIPVTKQTKHSTWINLTKQELYDKYSQHAWSVAVERYQGLDHPFTTPPDERDEQPA